SSSASAASPRSLHSFPTRRSSDLLSTHCRYDYFALQIERCDIGFKKAFHKSAMGCVAAIFAGDHNGVLAVCNLVIVCNDLNGTRRCGDRKRHFLEEAPVSIKWFDAGL